MIAPCAPAIMSPVSSLLKPFTGYIPASGFGPRIVGPPSVLLTKEQKRAAKREPLSFRHAAGRKARTPHNRANEWVATIDGRGGWLRANSAVVVYRQRTDDHTAIGLLANVSLSAYRHGLIKPHERTIARTQKKMATYMRTTRIYGNPATLTHPSDPSLASMLVAHVRTAPDVSFLSINGTQHEMWIIAGTRAEELCDAYVGPLYITDGHHRFSAAADVALAEERHDATLPVGLFGAEQLSLRSFARCITDPSLDLAKLHRQLEAAFKMRELPGDLGRPDRRGQLVVGMRGRRYLLKFDEATLPETSFDALDVKLLQSQILQPLLGVTDARKDKRVHFAPDIPGAAVPEFDADVWFLPYPPLIEDVFSVADLGLEMPAKSTLFFPKLPSGLIIRQLDED